MERSSEQCDFGIEIMHFAAKFAKYGRCGGVWSFTTFTDVAFTQRYFQFQII